MPQCSMKNCKIHTSRTLKKYGVSFFRSKQFLITMWERYHLVPLSLLILTSLTCVITEEPSREVVWRWACQEGKCLKTLHDSKDSDPPLSLEACKMFCNEFGLLWPMPTGAVDLGNFLAKINLDKVQVTSQRQGLSSGLMDAATRIFMEKIRKVVPKGATPKSTGKSLNIYLVNENPDIREISLEVPERYSLRVSGGADGVNATLAADSFLGLRHGLETLAQLIVYDDIRDHILIVRDVSIDDKPVYPYRGILLDTARNYIDVDIIKQTLDAMATVKLNTFHWHITDSQSFPFVSQKRPTLSKLGAYSPHKVYSMKTIKEIVQYGLERGIRVLPEFDAPAHVGEGWQDTDLTVCFKAEPWTDFCVEPPCGQLNPTKDQLYDVLEDIYADMAESFQPDLFHMGGDEVSERCWNSSQQIRDFMHQNSWGDSTQSYLRLWDYFQRKAQERVYKAFGKKIPIIMWTSTLTDFADVDRYLNKDEYIIQVWTTGTDPQIQGLLQKGYRLIMSNYDALYFDCGFGAWVGTGNNWCSPYIGWQKVYDNSPAQIAGAYGDQILGGEAALWSEQADSSSTAGRLWPRAAALAERLWAEPDTDWQHAEQRVLHVRERLVRQGVQAEALEPEWCYQNEGFCHQ